MTNTISNPITITANTSFIYEVTDATTNCSNQDTVNVTVNPLPVLSIGSITPDNCSDGSGAVELLATSGTTPYDYSIDGATYTPNNVFNELQGGQSYNFYTTDNNNCSDTLIGVIIPTGTSTPPSPPSVITPVKICEGEQITITDTVSSNASYSHIFVYYDFPDATTINSTTNVTQTPPLTGLDSIFISVTNSDGCISSATITDIDFTENNMQTTPINDICQGDSHTFEVWSIGLPDSLLWRTNGTQNGELSDQSSFTISNLTDNEIYVSVKENDCWFNDTISVTFSTDCEEVITNAFQPDGDIEENSFFYLDDEHVNPDLWENIVTIYNRWGDIVFKKPNYDNKNTVWRGENSFNNIDLPEGTYYYTLDVPEISYSNKGWVYLDR